MCMFLLVCMLSVDSLGARAQSIRQWTYSKAEIPNLFETSGSSYGRQFFHPPGVVRAGGGGGLVMIQVQEGLCSYDYLMWPLI